MSQILVINSGSSSLKYQLIDTARQELLAKGLVERIGEGEVSDHAAALSVVFAQLDAVGFGLQNISAVGHRVVHGGALYSAPTVIDTEVIAGIESLVPLAPLHNPPALLGIRAVSALAPQLTQVAVFDTAFHSSIPEVARTYALPVELAANLGIRRYGFHGTSHQYVTHRTAQLLGMPVDQVNLVICHIGNGASVTAVHAGKSVDTSMGLTPLEGLVMGTRSGDIDPGIVFHLSRVGGLDISEIDAVLNRHSGLLGMAGQGDMRQVRDMVERGDAAARLAVDVYTYRLRKYIAAYLGVVPGVHAVAFTAGVGENDPDCRAETLRPLAHLGLLLDEGRNAAGGADRLISRDDSPIAAMVVATNEELAIALQTAAVTA